MKKMLFFFLVIAGGQVHAADDLVNVDQMGEESVLKKPVDKAIPIPVNGQQAEAPTHTIGDDLKQVLIDHKISALGRANQAVSSQYGGQKIVETQYDKKTTAKKQLLDDSGNGVMIPQ